MGLVWFREGEIYILGPYSTGDFSGLTEAVGTSAENGQREFDPELLRYRLQILKSPFV
jgi:hypothetical protein